MRFAGLLLCLGVSTATASADEATMFFRISVEPLLKSRCLSCHSQDLAEGGLRLDSREALLKGGERGAAVVLGKPSDSLLLHAVHQTRKDLIMPPKEKLAPAEVAALERWIREGAVWPAPIPENSAAATSVVAERIGDAWSDKRNPIVKIFGGRRLDLWSLKPLKRTIPPVVRQKPWVRTPIDRFILARQEAAGLSPSQEADRRALLRRLSFDLIGLPPTPEEVQAFLADARPDAYEQVVDRLLASPRYGEHWARMWLDVVRYSDSNGFDWDEFRPNAWKFRDYVVRSFNADKPFDRFVREQLAGDELLAGPPRTADEQDALLATGFLRLGPQDNSAGAFDEQLRARTELLADLVESTGSAFLGMTLSCCRCHDHKYDPLSQADHYRFRAFFEGVKYADELPCDLAAEQVRIRRRHAEIDAKVKLLVARRDATTAPVHERLRNQRKAKLSAQERTLVDAKPKGPADADQKKREELASKIDPSADDVNKALSAADKTKVEALDKEIDALKAAKPAFTHALLMTDATEKPPATHILAGGDPKAPREMVSAGFLSALDPNPAALPTSGDAHVAERRSALAAWIASTKNPLTARVLINRVWQGFFGRGIVATPNDLGHSGAKPTHPELLDWLAAEFMRQGWSLKKLHRLIVTSAVYRQSSQPSTDQRGDADGALYTRQSLRRLSAEQLRDSLLTASGTMQPKAGGSPVWPDLPAEVLQANPAFLDDNAEKTKGWYPSPAAEQKVRSLYLVQKRTVRIPFLEAFDLPDNATSCPRRNVSTVAPQALALLNAPFALQLANDLAARVRNAAGADRGKQIEAGFQFCLQRSPTAREKETCMKFLARQDLVQLCRALFNLNEFAYVD